MQNKKTAKSRDLKNHCTVALYVLWDVQYQLSYFPLTEEDIEKILYAELWKHSRKLRLRLWDDATDRKLTVTKYRKARQIITQFNFYRKEVPQ